VPVSTKPPIPHVEPKIQDKVTKLKIGEKYQIHVSHVNSPDNFFVILSSNLSKKANLMNNLDNYYRK
jgi:hypothetical protein